MPKIRAYVDGKQVGGVFARALGPYPDRARAAARAAVQDMADRIEQSGRADIQAGGNFGTRWTEGFHARVTQGGGNLRVSIMEEVPYWRVFEYGANIQPNNPSGLLWIPLDQSLKGIWPKDYPGRLFRVDRSRTEKRWRGSTPFGPRSEPMHPTHSMSDKAPLLMDADTKTVKYFGKPDVTIPQKFHFRVIVREELGRLPLLFRAHTKEIAKAGG
jgi:hypothetical protein